VWLVLVWGVGALFGWWSVFGLGFSSFDLRRVATLSANGKSRFENQK
jgi:hypothetical protein